MPELTGVALVWLLSISNIHFSSTTSTLTTTLVPEINLQLRSCTGPYLHAAQLDLHTYLPRLAARNNHNSSLDFHTALLK